MELPTTKRRIAGLGSRVRGMREAYNMTLQVMAVRGGTTPQTLLQLENFDIASTRTLNIVARVFACTVDELTGRTAQRST